MVIDEAHNLPDSMVDFFTVKASSKWPRFDFSGFMMINKAKYAHPDNVSTSAFDVFKKWFHRYCEQEEKRSVLLNKAVQKFEVMSRISGGSSTPVIGIRENRCGLGGSFVDTVVVKRGSSG